VKERWNLLDSVVWICHSFIVGRKNEWFMRKKWLLWFFQWNSFPNWL